jgi:hypothetical protein
MNSVVDLNKQVFEKQQYQQVVDTSFTQLTVGGVSLTAATAVPLPTVQEFFDNYAQLFYQIPKTGETNSHQYLVNQSSAYIGGEGNNEEITALLAEVTALREENLQLQQQLLDIKPING